MAGILSYFLPKDKVFYSLFDHIKHHVSDSSGEEIQKIMNEFLLQSDDFVKDLAHGDPKHIYQPES